MEVTKSNFKEVLASLPKVFEKAQFIAIDTEFTGLSKAGLGCVRKYDTLETLFKKNKLRTEIFMVIQYGIVVFNFDESTKSYSHQGYNFYVYPSSLCPDTDFTCQARSLELLVQHDFDFNKLIKEGIPYLTDEETKKLQSQLDKKLAKHLNVKEFPLDIPNEYQEIINGIINKIKNILKSGKKENFEIEKLHGHIRKLIYNSVKCQFGNKVFITTNKDETMTATVGLTSKQYKEQVENKFEDERSIVMENVGFSNVLKLILNSGKLIVGHNVLIDIMFTIQQFIQPLPNTFKEFIELAHFLFPKIIDTKFLVSKANVKNLKDSSLYSVLKYFEGTGYTSEIKVADNGVGFSTDDNKLHSAAYDAFVTGVCFLAICSYLGQAGEISEMFSSCILLSQSLNKMSIPKLLNISCVDLEKFDGSPDRSNVFYIEFPEEWEPKHLEELFKNCGTIDISWLNSESAFVSVDKRYKKQVEKLKTVNSEYQLYDFKEYCNSLICTCIKPSNHTKTKGITPGNQGNSSNDDNSMFKTKKQKVIDFGVLMERL